MEVSAPFSGERRNGRASRYSQENGALTSPWPGKPGAAPPGVGAGRDVNDAGGSAGLDAVEKEAGEEEVAEVVDAERGLEALLRLRPLAEDEPGVIDEDVEPVVALEEGGGEGADRGERGGGGGQQSHGGAAAPAGVGGGMLRP